MTAHAKSTIRARRDKTLGSLSNRQSAGTGGPKVETLCMGTPGGGGGTPRLGILLAAAMFVFVIDTSFMNVSISAVVHDLDTTVRAVKAAVTTGALVSALFILISSKIGDLFGRKRAYVVGLVFYAAGALAMVVAQSVWAIIVFWAVIGGLGASLYLPAMQSLIHGNFE